MRRPVIGSPGVMLAFVTIFNDPWCGLMLTAREAAAIVASLHQETHMATILRSTVGLFFATLAIGYGALTVYTTSDVARAAVAAAQAKVAAIRAARS